MSCALKSTCAAVCSYLEESIEEAKYEEEEMKHSSDSCFLPSFLQYGIAAPSASTRFLFSDLHRYHCTTDKEILC